MSGGSIPPFKSPRRCRGARGFFCWCIRRWLANALAHLPEAIPALARTFPHPGDVERFHPVRGRSWSWPLASPTCWSALRSASTRESCLGALGARPLWNSALLGPLFLFSGLSTAAALLHGILVLTTPDEERPAFADFLLSSLARLGRGASARSKKSDRCWPAPTTASLPSNSACLSVPDWASDFHGRSPAGGRAAAHRTLRGGLLGLRYRNGDPSSARAPDARTGKSHSAHARAGNARRLWRPRASLHPCLCRPGKSLAAGSELIGRR